MNLSHVLKEFVTSCSEMTRAEEARGFTGARFCFKRVTTLCAADDYSYKERVA
jgi:hypothetical protein